LRRLILDGWDIMITWCAGIDIYIVEHRFDYFYAVVNGIDIIELVEYK
jgi:hypothetical protein